MDSERYQSRAYRDVERYVYLDGMDTSPSGKPRSGERWREQRDGWWVLCEAHYVSGETPSQNHYVMTTVTSAGIPVVNTRRLSYRFWNWISRKLWEWSDWADQRYLHVAYPFTYRSSRFDAEMLIAGLKRYERHSIRERFYPMPRWDDAPRFTVDYRDDVPTLQAVPVHRESEDLSEAESSNDGVPS